MDELYPNSTNKQDGPWSRAKKRIAEQLEDLTLLWFVSDRGRKLGHEAGVKSWRDPQLTPEMVGVTGDRRREILQAVLDVNREEHTPPVQPARIRAAESDWRRVPPVEFYVDFETVNDLADDFTALPEKGGQALIFMIGCGHLEGGNWDFESFVVDSLNETEEARIIDDWLAYMDQVRCRLGPSGVEPPVVHWSHAEESTFETAYNSAKERHPESEWPSLCWFDFLGNVMRREPVVVRGALNFGLKAIAKAMHRHRLIDTLWEDGPTDGLGAMVGAWWCQQEAACQGTGLADLDLMQEVVRYNEVDCRVMMEVISYLREHH